MREITDVIGERRPGSGIDQFRGAEIGFPQDLRRIGNVPQADARFLQQLISVQGIGHGDQCDAAEKRLQGERARSVPDYCHPTQDRFRRIVVQEVEAQLLHGIEARQRVQVERVRAVGDADDRPGVFRNLQVQGAGQAVAARMQ